MDSVLQYTDEAQRKALRVLPLRLLGTSSNCSLQCCGCCTQEGCCVGSMVSRWAAAAPRLLYAGQQMAARGSRKAHGAVLLARNCSNSEVLQEHKAVQSELQFRVRRPGKGCGPTDGGAGMGPAGRSSHVGEQLPGSWAKHGVLP